MLLSVVLGLLSLVNLNNGLGLESAEYLALNDPCNAFLTCGECELERECGYCNNTCVHNNYTIDYCPYGENTECVWRGEETHCGSDTHINNSPYLYFSTRIFPNDAADRPGDNLRGYWRRLSDRVYGDNINYADTLCDDSIVCNTAERYAGTYVYTFTDSESDTYYMYEVPGSSAVGTSCKNESTFPRIVISTSLCSDDIDAWVFRSPPLAVLAVEENSWPQALVRIATNLNATNETSLFINNFTNINHDEIDCNARGVQCAYVEWEFNSRILRPLIDLACGEQTMIVQELCDNTFGLQGIPCIAFNYTAEPTPPFYTEEPTTQPTFPTIAPSYATNAPTGPTQEPTPSPLSPTASPTGPTLSPTTQPTVPTLSPTRSPTDGACPEPRDGFDPRNCTGDEYCQVCNYPDQSSAGCSQCVGDGDYFKFDYDYPCENCYRRFGKGCMFCQDFNGCGQCSGDYTRRYCDSCQMWYCTPKCYEFTEDRFTEQVIIDSNTFEATLEIGYEDIGCTNLNLDDVKLYVLLESSDISNLEIEISHEGVDVIVQDCSGVPDCVGQANEEVLIDSSLRSWNSDEVCEGCQASSGSSLLTSESYAIRGSYMPTNSMSGFSNTAPSGTWVVRVRDTSGFSETNIPWLYEYTLTICPNW